MGQLDPMAQADLRRVERARKHVLEAREELENAIRDAVASGETYRDVAARAGMSHQRVAQIVAAKRSTEPLGSTRKQ